MAITRAKVIQALELLGIDPATTDEVMIFSDKVVVRKREVLPVEDEAPHEH